MNNMTPIPDPASNWFWDQNSQSWQCGCPPQQPGCPPVPVVIQPPFPPPFLPPPVTQPPWYPGANGGVSFGVNAPPNPIRGAFWWDGVTPRMFDGAAWVGVGGASGGTTPPSTNPPSNPSPGQQWFNGSTLFVWDGNAWVPVAGTKTTISATAPPSPGPGDLWYDGTQMRIWDGSAWELVGPGATVGPVPTTTEVFKITQPTNLSIGTSQYSVVPFTATPLIDAQGAFDPVTKRITPKVAGMYNFQIRSYSSGAFVGVVLLKNDTGAVTGPGVDNWVAVGQVSGQVTGSDLLQSSGLTRMNGTTDFVRLFAVAGDGNFVGLGQNGVVEGFLMT